MAQRAVVEVGAQRDDDADPGARRGDEVDELVDEPSRRVVVDLGEQLLELVDHQQQLVVVVGQDAIDGAAHAARREEQVEQRVRWVRSRRGASAASSSSNGCGAGVISMRNQSADIGSAPCASAGSRPGAHDARLAAAARPDDGDEASAGAGLAEAGDEPLDEAFPPEEVAGVGGAERPQPLVRVLDRGVVEQRRCR